jgi:GTP-binding protein
MLIDTVKIKIRAGRGGNGSLTMNLESPTGGDGGAGGNIIFVGDENVYDLSWYDYGRTYKSGFGENGAKGHKTGSDGADLVLMVPLTTEIRHGRRLICRIDKHGQKEVVLQGAAGGFGNISISKESEDGVYDPLALPVEGSPSVDKEITLMLKLQADVIFLGLPNAGKSSMLNVLTDAQAKVAAYAFTTLEPQIGMMQGIKLMDLPGLIEDTAEGKGLGTRFVKHTESTRLVVHFLSLTEADPLNGYQVIRKEIAAISPKLAAVPEILVLTKSDEVTPEIITKVTKDFGKQGIKPLIASIIDDDSISKLRSAIKAQLRK